MREGESVEVDAKISAVLLVDSINTGRESSWSLPGNFLQTGSIW